MSGHVGIIANDAGRYTMFSVCLTQLQSPVNTQVLWKLTSDRIIGRNSVVRDALEAGTEWVFFLDDDHVFAPDVLTRLLAHDVGIVAALYLQRQAPFAPIAYASRDDEKGYAPIDLTSLPPDGLVEVVACGTGGMLIRAEILRGMFEPWFEHGRASEDLMFCDKVNELGMGPIYVDTSVRLGHLSMASVWPSYGPNAESGEGEWSVGFAVADNFSLKAPISPPEPVGVPG